MPSTSRQPARFARLAVEPLEDRHLAAGLSPLVLHAATARAPADSAPAKPASVPSGVALVQAAIHLSVCGWKRNRNETLLRDADRRRGARGRRRS